MKPVYKDELITLYHGNSLEVLKKFEENSVDVVITDPPFFLSNGGVSCKNGRMVSVDKGEWDKLDSMTIEEFYTEILVQLKRILKFDGSIWIFGTMHNVYVLGYLMNKLEFKIMNNITWQKTN
ncbi:TPA: site-specific DNA-methyltransferase, partial [Enterococcus faecalis]|nr:site-specific DNA-methyltransferase [Enterococcus faecalis]